MNKFRYINYEGEKCVEFITNGKYQKEVLVDAESWDKYLCKHNWTITKNKAGYMTVRASIDKRTVKTPKLITENEFSELDYGERQLITETMTHLIIGRRIFVSILAN